jgi:hypothetical protein
MMDFRLALAGDEVDVHELVLLHANLRRGVGPIFPEEKMIS